MYFTLFFLSMYLNFEKTLKKRKSKRFLNPCNIILNLKILTVMLFRFILKHNLTVLHINILIFMD